MPPQQSSNRLGAPSSLSGMLSPAEVYSVCAGSHRAFLARIKAVGNLVGQREAMAAANASSSLGGCDGSTVTVTTMPSAAAHSQQRSYSSSYALYAPSASPLGVLGFFGSAGSTNTTSPIDARICTLGSIEADTSSTVAAADSNPIVQLLQARLGNDVTALVGDLTDCALKIEQTAANGLSSPSSVAVGCGGNGGDASDGEEMEERAAHARHCALLASLLLQHSALLQHIAALVKKDVACEGASSTAARAGQYYTLLDAVVGMRDVLFQWFDFTPSVAVSSEEEAACQGQHGASTDATSVDAPPRQFGGGGGYIIASSFLSLNRQQSSSGGGPLVPRVPEQLLKLGAEYPSDLLEGGGGAATVNSFLSATAHLGGTSPGSDLIPPMILSEVLGLCYDGLSLVWPLLMASHPAMAWGLDLQE